VTGPQRRHKSQEPRLVEAATHIAQARLLILQESREARGRPVAIHLKNAASDLGAVVLQLQQLGSASDHIRSQFVCAEECVATGGAS